MASITKTIAYSKKVSIIKEDIRKKSDFTFQYLSQQISLQWLFYTAGAINTVNYNQVEKLNFILLFLLQLVLSLFWRITFFFIDQIRKNKVSKKGLIVTRFLSRIQFKQKTKLKTTFSETTSFSETTFSEQKLKNYLLWSF